MSAWLWLAGPWSLVCYVTVFLMTFDKQPNERRTEVDFKSNRRCSQCITFNHLHMLFLRSHFAVWLWFNFDSTSLVFALQCIFLRVCFCPLSAVYSISIYFFERNHGPLSFLVWPSDPDSLATSFSSSMSLVTAETPWSVRSIGSSAKRCVEIQLQRAHNDIMRGTCDYKDICSLV